MQDAIYDNAERDAIFERLKQIPENNKCIDCQSKNPKWASVYFGTLICMNCSAKHREMSVKYSFARSLTLDTWNKKQMLFMELGGNAKAVEYFRKHGLRTSDTTPPDYKSPNVQRYKEELVRHVEATLKAMSGQAPVVQSPQPVESPMKTAEAAPLPVPKAEAPKEEVKENNPFAKITQPTVIKEAGFTITFNNNKNGQNSTGKPGQVKAKKIDDIDFSALTLDDSNTATKPATNTGSGMSDGAFNKSTSPSEQSPAPKPVAAPISFSSAGSNNNPSDAETLKKYSNAKAISSDHFFNEGKQGERFDKGRLSGNNAISSAQYFGEPEDDSQGRFGEGLKNMLFNAKEKLSTLKDKASTYVQKWQHGVEQ